MVKRKRIIKTFLSQPAVLKFAATRGWCQYWPLLLARQTEGVSAARTVKMREFFGSISFRQYRHAGIGETPLGAHGRNAATSRRKQTDTPDRLDWGTSSAAVGSAPDGCLAAAEALRAAKQRPIPETPLAQCRAPRRPISNISTSRLPHCEHTSRSRHASGMSGP
jgi:hypothetical protein